MNIKLLRHCFRLVYHDVRPPCARPSMLHDTKDVGEYKWFDAGTNELAILLPLPIAIKVSH